MQISQATIQYYLSGGKLPKNLKKQVKAAIKDLKQAENNSTNKREETVDIFKDTASEIYKAYFLYKPELPSGENIKITEQIFEHQGKLSTSDSLWAPWSKNYKIANK